jgi:hypothetical protein
VSPRFLDKVAVDSASMVDPSTLPFALPYGLAPNVFFRTVEDVHDLIHDVNTLLHAKSYRRLEELLDPAGFSGLISRTVAERLSRASRQLVVNQFHNGYPDLLVDGQYPGNSVQRGEGGLEIKASRKSSSWQSHGPRAGWFCVVQFELDEDSAKAVVDRNPTCVRAVMLAELGEADWNWQPAGPGRMRSGTASVKPSGIVKLRAGAVWVDPTYRAAHDAILVRAVRAAARAAPTI